MAAGGGGRNETTEGAVAIERGEAAGGYAAMTTTEGDEDKGGHPSGDTRDVGSEGEARWRRCESGCGVGEDEAEVVVGIFKGVDPVDGDEDRNAGGIRGGGGVERAERGDKTGEGVEGQGSAQDKSAEVR